MIEAIPDKSTYKSTITNELREYIVKLGSEFACPTFLEIGCCVGYTTAYMVRHFDFVVAVDINEEKVSQTIESIKKYSPEFLHRSTVMKATSDTIPEDLYDVVLLDASHMRDDVKRDVNNVLKKNLSKKFYIVFHDYGLKITTGKKGVKEYVDEFWSGKFVKCGEEKDWNLKGAPTYDWEAACVLIDKSE